MKIHRIIQNELDRLSADKIRWRIESGGKHWKIFVGDMLAAIQTKGSKEAPRHSLMNARAQIRRAAQIEREKKNGNGQHTRT